MVWQEGEFEPEVVGPYEILHHVGEVDYELECPRS